MLEVLGKLRQQCVAGLEVFLRTPTGAANGTPPHSIQEGGSRWHNMGLMPQRAALGGSGRTEWGNPTLQEASAAPGEGNRKEGN